jgi:hypothetical protein
VQYPPTLAEQLGNLDPANAWLVPGSESRKTTTVFRRFEVFLNDNKLTAGAED